MCELPARLAERLRAVRSVGAITGAGVSAESGIRTYRGQGGIYDDPEDGERTVEALSGPTLLGDPDRTWRAVAALSGMAVHARPNPAHRALVEMERRAARFVLLTQNVDGLHQMAGSCNVIDIHGDVAVTECRGCGARGRIEREERAHLRAAPLCAACGSVLRPGVVLFGEMLPEDKVARLRAAFYEDPPDLVLVAGTTALFPYIAGPVQEARRRGRLTVEVNPEETVLCGTVDFSLRGPAGVWLPAIAKALP